MSHTSYKAAHGKINYENAQGLKLTVKNVSLSNIIFYNEIKILSNVSGYTKMESSIIAIFKSLKGKIETR